MTDRELLDDINNNGRYGHFTKDAQGNRIAEIDISDNPNNPAKGTVRNYGVCEDRVLRASKKGIVFRSYQDNYGAWIISIKHDNDQVSSYGHLAVKSPLNPGTPVEEGDAIGTMGCTGSCTGIHVHFDVSIGNTKVDNWRFKLLPDTTAPSGGFQSPVQGATVQRYVVFKAGLYR